MMLMVSGVYTGYVVVLAWISNTIPRPPAKRAAALAAINAVSNSTSIWTSYLYVNEPRYSEFSPLFAQTFFFVLIKTKENNTLTFVLSKVMAFSVNSGLLVFAAICATILRLMLTRLNKKLDRGEHVEGAINAVPGQAADRGFRFLT